MTFNTVDSFLTQKRVLALVFLAIAASVYTHSMVFNEWHMPTFGNTMIHVASARHLVEHAYYPIDNDYSYGGGVPNLYVPIYRFLLAETVVLTGLSFDFASRLLVLFFAILLPLGFYLLGRELFGEAVGIASAFFSVIVPELLIYTIRPLPQSLGMVLLPIGFYLLARNLHWHSFLFALLISWVHQEAALFLAASAFAVFCFTAFNDLVLAKKKIGEIKNGIRSRISGISLTAFGVWLVSSVSYLAWHFYAVGDLNLLKLAQFTQHEGNVVNAQLLLDKTGLVVTALSAVGLVALIAVTWFKAQKREAIHKELFLLALAATGLALVKNDLVGLRVFMDRFIVFLHEPMIILAGLGLVVVLNLLLTQRFSTLLQKS